MTSRAKNTALVLKNSGGDGLNISGLADRKALSEVAIHRKILIPPPAIDEIVAILSKYDRIRTTKHKQIRPRTQLETYLQDIEAGAEQIIKALAVFQADKLGREHPKSWLHQYEVICPGLSEGTTYTEAGDRGLAAMLSVLSNIRQTAYEKISVKEHHADQVGEIAMVFDNYGVAVSKGGRGVLGRLLVEIESQFPGAIFPPNYSSTERQENGVPLPSDGKKSADAVKKFLHRALQ